MDPSGTPHLSISVTCQAPTMKRNQRKSAVEVKALREQMGHLEATLGGMVGLRSAAADVAGAVTMLRQVRATEEPQANCPGRTSPRRRNRSVLDGARDRDDGLA